MHLHHSDPADTDGLVGLLSLADADHLLTLATGSELAELEVADQAALRRQYLG